MKEKACFAGWRPRSLGASSGPRFVKSGTSSRLLTRRPWRSSAALVGTPSCSAGALRRPARGPGTQILVGVYQDESQRVLDRTTAFHPHVHPVSAKLTALADQLFERASLEVIARARHEQYVRRALERGETVERFDDSLVAWDNLQPSLQASNRRFAQSVGGGHREAPRDHPATRRPRLQTGDLELADESLRVARALRA